MNVRHASHPHYPSRRRLLRLCLALSLPPVLAQTGAAQSASAKVQEISWDDLWPEGEDARLQELFDAYFAATGKTPDGVAEGGAQDKMPQIGTYTTVAKLNGREIRIPGYVVPLDFDAKDQHSEFLLVPYFGACIHTPPPPPNQIIHVRARPPARIKDVWSPMWAEGVLTTERIDHKIGNAAYALTLSRIEPYS